MIFKLYQIIVAAVSLVYGLYLCFVQNYIETGMLFMIFAYLITQSIDLADIKKILKKEKPNEDI